MFFGFGHRNLDHVDSDNDRHHVMGQFHRRWLSNGGAESRLLFVSARTGRDDDWDRVRVVGTGKLRPPAIPWAVVQSTSVRRGILDDCHMSGRWSFGVAVSEP